MMQQMQNMSKHQLSDHIKQLVEHLEDVEQHISHIKTINDHHRKSTKVSGDKFKLFVFRSLIVFVPIAVGVGVFAAILTFI